MTNRHLHPRLVLLLALACGIAVANLYYAQPLLDTIASKLGTSSGVAGLVVTFSQVGYAAGLLLLVPLGDLVERRTLVVRLLLLCAVALAGCALAPSIGPLALAIAVVGLTSVVAQVLIPLAGDLAADDERGKVVGTIMSGLLIGILLARTVSGFVAELAGWRAIYVLAAVLMVALAFALQRALPVLGPRTQSSYGQVLRSVGTLVRSEPLLRLRMAYGMLGMLTFTLLWTALTFLLSGAPYHYSDGTIGLFGLAGLVGAFAAQGAGRLADRGLARAATGCFWAAVLVGWLLADLGGSSVIALIAGLLILDAGVQGQHITNQSVIYSLRPDARSRLTTAYMTGNFTAAAVGSALASALWDVGGWGLISGVGVGTTVVALGLWALERRRVSAPDRPAAVQPQPHRG
ncbi:MFS transporter [Conexibacter sp. JD483]|uniref:MFS transporter n=1 Tax=unclassified Conexibacter TaxID=2627773 RepID=UPI0027209573|nr:MULTISPECIES: MFS transporter [unclassified Conexibacter]MDO8186614.1 MFS transporter [Conexibacter sp. CPCC 205706]MDO8196719.1 MFS transporter [Conexibacter sp. CPCC 205762]MDR9370914.1 MFS transporter [Conexibacter sp. JD483]